MISTYTFHKMRGTKRVYNYLTRNVRIEASTIFKIKKTFPNGKARWVSETYSVQDAKRMIEDFVRLDKVIASRTDVDYNKRAV